MRISFDLDSTIFDMEPLYKRAYRDVGEEYKLATHWDLDKYCSKNVENRLVELFSDDYLYTMPVLSADYPMILNTILQDPRYETFFVTQRRLRQPEKSFQQLRDAGIQCNLDQVYDNPTPKVDILKKLNVDLHFDDGPHVVTDCLREGVNVAMISNNKTLYNHYLRGQVKYYNDLKTALRETGIYTR